MTKQRSYEWLLGRIDEYYGDTSRSAAETLEDLKAACEHIQILQNTLTRDLEHQREKENERGT